MLAYPLQSLDCDVFDPSVHIMYVGGERDGWTCHIENARAEFGDLLVVDKSHLFTVNDGKLYLDGKFVR